MARFNDRLLFEDPTVSASFTSDVIPVKIADCIFFEFVRTGTLVGIVSLEASISGDNWSLVPNSANTVDSTVPTYIVELRKAVCPYYRVTYQHTLGLGEVNLKTYIKGY